MKKNKIAHITHFLIVALLYGCANKAQGPTGGPKDETPPSVIRSTPETGALNFKKKEIQIYFDENITVEKPNELIVISPPQLMPPDIKGNGRVVNVIFDNDLIDSTTYTIDFGSSIVDLNERNSLKNYRFSFSTGNEIDTLQLSGTVIDASDLNPLSGVMVGIYNANDEKGIFEKPFLRIAKTDDNGKFTIDNVKKGNYLIYALMDLNKDFYFQTGERVAFIDSTVTPIVSTIAITDTIKHIDTMSDSIVNKHLNKFLPDNLVFRLFNENKKRLNFKKYMREKPEFFVLYFNAPSSKLPEITPLNFDWKDKYMIQPNKTNDTITYWLMDSTLIATDTLTFSMKHEVTDSVFKLQTQTDTLNVIFRKQSKRQNAKTALKPEKQYLNIKTNESTSFDIFSPFTLQFEAPIDTILLHGIVLENKVDTIFKPLKFSILQTDATKTNFQIEYAWESEKSYRIRIDSAAIRNIYQHTNKGLQSDIKIKSLASYSAIKISTTTFDSTLVFQILDTKDAVIQTSKAHPNGTEFKFLKPGDYYIRAFKDENGNARWDTGDLKANKQPEEVFYHSKKLSLRANWAFEEIWDLMSIPLLEQKPTELKKLNTVKAN